jgi:hypothetical protein
MFEKELALVKRISETFLKPKTGQQMNLRNSFRDINTATRRRFSPEEKIIIWPAGFRRNTRTETIHN